MPADVVLYLHQALPLVCRCVHSFAYTHACSLLCAHTFSFRQDALTLGVSSVAVIAPKSRPPGQASCPYTRPCICFDRNHPTRINATYMLDWPMYNLQTYTCRGHSRTGNIDRIRATHSHATVYLALPRAKTHSGEPGESGPVRG